MNLLQYFLLHARAEPNKWGHFPTRIDRLYSKIFRVTSEAKSNGTECSSVRSLSFFWCIGASSNSNDFTLITAIRINWSSHPARRTMRQAQPDNYWLYDTLSSLKTSCTLKNKVAYVPRRIVLTEPTQWKQKQANPMAWNRLRLLTDANGLSFT